VDAAVGTTDRLAAIDGASFQALRCIDPEREVLAMSPIETHWVFHEASTSTLLLAYDLYDGVVGSSHLSTARVGPRVAIGGEPHSC
jgi:hypothetical protein